MQMQVNSIFNFRGVRWMGDFVWNFEGKFNIENCVGVAAAAAAAAGCVKLTTCPIFLLLENPYAYIEH